MSVPLDRLYHYLDDCVNHDLLIYGWFPHGSRNLSDLTGWGDYSGQQLSTYAPMICHDQEPLNYALYSRTQIEDFVRQHLIELNLEKYYRCNAVLEYLSNQHLKSAVYMNNPYDCVMLLHSELNSRQVDVYAQNGFIPVYYWGHAVIAQDWFRYAQHDPKLHFDLGDIKKDFLVYNRAWAGTREYRLYFTEQLIQHKLLNYTQITFNTIDDTHYKNHVFKNKNLQISNYTIEQYLQPTLADSTASADYNNDDYANTGIEVVLETLFDDTCWHLTEKSLRPIACGKPFILAATPGSLQYLRNYGFETFDGLIDESYNTITDSKHRLNAIVQEMKRIAALDTGAKQILYTKLHRIAQRNKQRFFNGLVDQVMEEYQTNINQAMIIMQQHCTDQRLTTIQQLLHQN